MDGRIRIFRFATLLAIPLVGRVKRDGWNSGANDLQAHSRDCNPRASDPDSDQEIVVNCRPGSPPWPVIQEVSRGSIVIWQISLFWHRSFACHSPPATSFERPFAAACRSPRCRSWPGSSTAQRSKSLQLLSSRREPLPAGSRQGTSTPRSLIGSIELPMCSPLPLKPLAPGKRPAPG